MNNTRWMVLGAVALMGVASTVTAQEPAPAEPAPAAAAAAAPEAAPTSEAAQPVSASASPDAAAGTLQLGLRAGFSFPGGDAVKRAAMSDSFTGAVPVQFDVGIRASRAWILGAYAGYGVVLVKECSAELTCTAQQLRVGFQAEFHTRTSPGADPWFGIGTGYEDLHLAVKSSTRSSDGHISGAEFLTLQAGVALKLGNALTIGPFGSASFAQYVHTSNGDRSEWIDCDLETLHHC